MPDRFKDTVTSYKLGFGGTVVVRPEPSVLISNPVLDVAIRWLYPRLWKNAWVKHLQKRIRLGSGGPTPSDRSTTT